ncbi:MAG: RluA family pseudouridine synthase [Clostridia bacterium]|jgi:23S rRNA pseudouridine1911/1915/1917 synthase
MDLIRIIDEKDQGTAVKNYLKKEFRMSGGLIRLLKEEGGLLLNDRVPYLSDKFVTGDRLSVSLQCAFGQSDLLPFDAPLSVLYEDPWMIAVDKPPDVLVHPVTYEENGTLANMVRMHQINKGEEYTIRPVSRLDRNTSGIVLFAKNSYIQHILQLQGREGEFLKDYLALVTGTLDKRYGRITNPIGRKTDSIVEHEVTDTGKEAITEYTVIKQYRDFALVKIRIFTGRTHQIRVHMSSIGYPVTGDNLYKDPHSMKVKRQCLHAYQVQLIHPITREKIFIKSPLPKDIRNIIRLGINGSDFT